MRNKNYMVKMTKQKGRGPWVLNDFLEQIYWHQLILRVGSFYIIKRNILLVRARCHWVFSISWRSPWIQRLHLTVPQSLGWQMEEIIVFMSSIVSWGLSDKAFKELSLESGTQWELPGHLLLFSSNYSYDHYSSPGNSNAQLPLLYSQSSENSSLLHR